MANLHSEDLLRRIEQLNNIGIALSAERDTSRLLEMILIGAKSLTRADGGSLYSLDPERGLLRLEIMRTESLDLAMGGSTGVEIPFPPITLYGEAGEPNKKNVVTCAVHEDQTIMIDDAYLNERFDFSGTREFDRRTGYRSRSFLTVPLKDHENEIIGVLQLINARDPDSGEILPFSTSDQGLTESLASQAAVALTTKRLIDDLETLFDSFVRLIATAIDEKSPHTGAHCRRVPLLTMLIAEAVHETEHGPLGGFRLTANERYQLELAAWLHDCGKITTPEHVVEKATKLQTIFDRIDLVDARFEIARRDAEIEKLRETVAVMKNEQQPDTAAIEERYADRASELEDDRRFLHRCNLGGESMAAADRERIERIATTEWTAADGESRPLLTADEVHNLTIQRGTLTPEERQVIDNHALLTIKMLESLPFPKHLQDVPEYAGAHHERMDGKGYPRGLTRDQMSIPARIMAVADIFEALTSSSRPYKTAMRVSEALRILGEMAIDQHVDPEVFEVFVSSGAYRTYAEGHLDPAQLDEVDVRSLPGMAPP